MEYLQEKYHRAAATVQTDVDALIWQPFELSVVDGMFCDEVAQKPDRPVGIVYAARRRVMRRLRDQIEHMEGDEQ